MNNGQRLSKIARVRIQALGVLLLLLTLITGALMYDVPAAHTRNPVLGIEEDGNGGDMSFEELEAFITRLERANDVLPDRTFDTIQAPYYLFALEALPYFEAEGITPQAILPTDMQWGVWGDARRHTGVAGQARCMSGEMWISFRYANIYSSWYGDPDFYWTLIHELAHAQGICLGDNVVVEASAQIATLEVMAALANSGNEIALYSLIPELQGMAMGALQYKAMGEGRMAEYEEFRHQLKDSPISDARRAQTVRKYASQQSTYQDLLGKYYLKPFNWFLEASVTGKVEGVELPINIPRYINSSSQGPVYKEWGNLPLIMDDTVYLLSNLEAIVGEVAAKAKAKK